MKKTFNNSSVILSIAELIVGVLLLINPVAFNKGIIIAVGVGLMVLGLYKIIRYFSVKPDVAARQGDFAKGFIFALVGILCTFNSAWVLATFPTITVLYGIMILVAGVTKLQSAIDILRLKRGSWGLMFFSAVVTVLVAVLVIVNPFTSILVLWKFLGITLIVAAVLDIVAFIASRKNKKDKTEAEQEEN